MADLKTPMAEDKPKILIVHDSSEDITHLQSILRSLDCISYSSTCNNGEVNELVKHSPPNLILLGTRIGERDGYEVAKSIRETNPEHLIPILFLTDSYEANGVHHSDGLEATDLLRKPYYPFELISRCKALLDLKKYEEELEVAEQVLRSLAIAVEARDPTTGNHCDRLFYRLAKMADLLKLGQEVKDTLLKGAVLHDIGKVGIPDHVLLKEGPLTDREWEVMRQHVIIGESLCRPLKFLHPVLPLIRHHHERYDGTGYPDGLKGSGIPIVARVFQICDVFDALTNPRPYKPAFAHDESILILQRETEKGWWDPVIVKTFLQMLENEK